jgi:hypothetical protein
MASISPALAASVVARARGAGTRGRDASARDAGVGVGVGVVVASRGATRATTRAHRGRRCAARASASEPAEGATASGGAKSERRREENPYGVEVRARVVASRRVASADPARRPRRPRRHC